MKGWSVMNENRENFYDLRKDATYKTSLINEEIYKTLNWNEIENEDNLAKTGMLVDSQFLVIKGDNPYIPVWDLRSYSFLCSNYIPYTVNPKLWIQGQLNLNAGLFKVTDNIYQIRGFDLANMTLIKGNNGWIVVDCLGSRETAEAALSLAKDYFGQIQVSAVIITHSLWRNFRCIR